MTATQIPAVADGFVNCFTDPLHGWAVLRDPERTAAFLTAHGWRTPAAAAVV